MNAAIRAAVRTASAHRVEVVGAIGGFDGLVNDRFRDLGPRDVSNIIQRGGTILRSARSEAFRSAGGRARAAQNLHRRSIDALITIGGNGTQAGAHALFTEHGVPLVGVASTIDNDLAGTDVTIGFDTACNTAVEAIDRLRDTASSHDRVFFVEVMGRGAGHIAARCALAAGAEAVLVPERGERIDELVALLRGSSSAKTSQIVVVAEGDEEGGAFAIAARVNKELPSLDMRVSVLGHLQRGGAPSVADRELASRLGHAAVEAVIAGKADALAGWADNSVRFTPLAEAITGGKPLRSDLLPLIAILAG